MSSHVTPRRTVLALLAGLSFLAAGCVPPPPTTLEPEGGYGPKIVDSRPLVPSLTGMDVSPTPGGVIVTASGMMVPGYWDVALVPETGDTAASEIRLEFRVRPPLPPPPDGAAATQPVQAGYFISNADLAGMRRITVIGADGSRSSNR